MSRTLSRQGLKLVSIPTGRDLLAGVSVALVLVPQSIAYAELAGLPAVTGLYAAIFPLLAAALFASSPWLQTGPVAMTSILTFAALSALAAPGTTDYVGMAALLAIVVGVTRVVVGLARAGFLVYLMSQPVLNGFTTAAALLIISTQLPALFGFSAPVDGFIDTAVVLFSQPHGWFSPGLALGVGAFSLIVIGRRLHPLFPGVLCAVVLGIAYQRLFDCHCTTVGVIPTEFPRFEASLPWQRLGDLLIPGIVIALLGFAEPAAICRTLAASSRRPWNASREFISQGVANLAAGFTGAFPVGGSFSRTMLNRTAGASTRWSGAITGLAVLAFLPVANLLSALPRPVLAAVIIAAVVPLIKFGPLFHLMRTSRAQSLIAWLTFFLTLYLAPRIDLAVLCGMGMGIVVHLWRERRISVLARYTDHTLFLVPVGVLYFGSAQRLDEILVEQLVKHPDAQALVLDLRKLGRIDYTGALVIQRIAGEAQKAQLEVRIIPGQPPQGARLLRRVFGDEDSCIDER